MSSFNYKKGWVSLILGTLGLVFIFWNLFQLFYVDGTFYWDFGDALEAREYLWDEEQRSQLDCEWGAQKYRGSWYCREPQCRKTNVENIRDKGVHCEYIGSDYIPGGFLSTGHMTEPAYACEGYGKVTVRCVDYFDNRSEYFEHMKERYKE